ncbi:MAG: hypothetical protein KAW89_06740 [Armatimonadetes bacterium]|nr:hypothetical protein [Armatimonadota bacterium]
MPSDWAAAIGEYVQTVAPSEYESHTKQVFVYLVSLTLPPGELSDLANRLSTDDYRFEVASPISVVQHVPDSPDVSTRTRTIKHPVGQGQASLVVPEPGPDFEFPDGSLGRWAVDITTETVGGIDQGLRFPVSPCLADRILRGELPRPSTLPPETEARVMGDGRLSIGVTGYNPTIFINLLDSFGIFKHALQAHSFRSAPRNVNYTPDRRLVFQASPRAYRTVERSHHGVAAMALANMLTEWRDAQQLLVWNDRLQYLAKDTRSAEQIAGKFDVEQERIDELFLPFLVKRKILLQGYYLKCIHCSTSAWYPLEDVGQQYRCSACLNMNQTPYKPEYSYKLVPLAERAVKYNQLLPLAVVGLLAQEAKSDFIWEPELVLKDPVGAGFQDSDIDICCVRDGELMMGEAAWDGGFKQKDADKLVGLARLLRPSEIVFAVMRRELKPGDQELIREVAERVDAYGTQVAVFLEHHLFQGERDAKPPRRFVANPETHKVHRWMCRYQPKMPRKWFETYQDAAKQGYRPCKHCRPNSD